MSDIIFQFHMNGIDYQVYPALWNKNCLYIGMSPGGDWYRDYIDSTIHWLPNDSLPLAVRNYVDRVWKLKALL